MTDTPETTPPATSPALPDVQQQPGRDARGYFLPGHKLGGRPKGIDVRAAFIEAHGEVAADQAVAEVMVAMVARAKQGDSAAAKVVLDRLAGPVSVAIEHDLSFADLVIAAHRGAAE